MADWIAEVVFKSKPSVAAKTALHNVPGSTAYLIEPHERRLNTMRRIDELEEALHLARAALWELGRWNDRDKFEADPAVKAIHKALRIA